MAVREPLTEKASILLVEHSSRDAERMAAGLRETAPQWDVETSHSGEDALAHLDSRDVSAIVLDEQLPDASGLDILNTIVRRGYPAPVIWVAPAGRAEEARHALDEGAYDVVIKDEAHLPQLPQVVNGAVQRYRLDRENRLLRDILQALTSAHPMLVSGRGPEDARTFLLDEAVRILGARGAWLLLNGPAGDLELLAWRGRAPVAVPGQRFDLPGSTAPQSRPDASPYGLSMDAVGEWLTPSARREAEAAGVERIEVVPLVMENRVEGALMLFFSRPAAFTEESMRRDVLRVLGSTLSFAVHAARQHERAQAARDELETAQEMVATSERLRMLGAMAAGIVHDFNNVMAIVKARAGLARRRSADSSLQRDMDIIQQAVADGTRTVRRLQEMAGIYKGRSLFAPVSPNRVVQSAVELTRPRWKDQSQAQGIPLEVRLDLQPVPDVAGSEAELREALINLIFNALDAMPEGGRLTLATRHQPASPETAEAVAITVQDTGQGMTPEVLARVFEPFHTTKGGPHAGMGLSICRNIITWHGGEIQAESRPGEGSTIIVLLPPARLQPAAKATAAKPQGRLRVLLIEDERGVREYLHEFLEPEGHTVRSAATGPEGLAAALSEPFDAVVTDLGLPGLSGWEVARRIHDRNPDLPILLLTGWGEPIDPERIKASGITEVLTKPFDGGALLEFLARYVPERQEDSD